MPDLLDMEFARRQARRLKSIPDFPFDEENVVAAAEDLISWCTGKIMDGRVWSAEDQAVWLVDKARNEFLKWQGIAFLHRMFVEKFEHERLGPAYRNFESLEKQYGKPDPAWSRRLLQSVTHKEQMSEFLLITVRDTIYYTEGPGRKTLEGKTLEAKLDREFWQEALENYTRRHPDVVAAIRAEVQREGAAYWARFGYSDGERKAS